MKFNNKNSSHAKKLPYSRKSQQLLPSLNNIILPSPPSIAAPVYQTLLYEEESHSFKEFLAKYSTDERILKDASAFFFGTPSNSYPTTALNSSKDFVLFEPFEQHKQQQQQHSSMRKKLIPDLDRTRYQ